MKLSQVRIENFKNFQKFLLDLKGPMNYEFIAKNKFGKSTIADAIFWVMTGKLLSGSSDIMSIKPKNDSKKLVSVELFFEDGTSVMKTYEENWVKTRGTKEKHLEGHTTNCFINGINIPVTKFHDSLLEKFGIKFDGKWSGNIFQLLIDPLFFGIKECWQERRKLVIDLVGDVTDEDVFKKDSDLEPLKKYLFQTNGKFEDVKKILCRNLKELNDDEKKLIAQIEVLSDEQTIAQERYTAAVKRQKEITEEIQKLNNKKYQEQKDIIAERKEEIANMKTKLSEKRQKDSEKYQKSIEKKQNELNLLQKEKSRVQQEFSDLNNDINELNQKKSDVIAERQRVAKQIEDNEKYMAKLRTKWENTNKSEYDEKDSLICPQCGHDLHGDIVEKKRKEFNLKKAEELEDIASEGKQLKKINEDLKAKVEELHDEEDSMFEQIEELKPRVSEYNEKLNEKTRKISKLNNSIPEFKYSKETLDFEEQIKELEQSPYPTINNEQEIDNQIGKLEQEKTCVQKVIDTYNHEQRNIQKANELQKKLDKVMDSIAEFESLQDMLSEFIKTKLNILNERVESVFGHIKFQLVESNIKEGSWNEVCYVLDGDVPYHNTNSASKIQLGIKVCEAIKKKLQIEGLFYVIDNAEQITDRDFSKLTPDQTISFVALDVEPGTRREDEMETNLFSLDGEK